MPIYEYQCEGCQHTEEVLQKVNDEPLVVCSSCNEAKLKKKVSAAGFRLKGSGWYETDFKTGSKKNLAGSESNSNETAKSDKSTSKATN